MAWRGMDLYRASLRGWPQAVADAAAPIIERHARSAFQQIHDEYPVVTGTLQRGLKLEDTTPDALHPRWTLRNDVVYAKIFETGGATLVGPKPHGHVFSRIAPAERRAMRAELVEMLDRVTPHG